MRVILAAIRKGGAESDLSRSLSAAARVYLERIQKFVPADSVDHVSEESLFSSIEKLRTRATPVVVLLDSRGKSFSSEELAAWIERQQDGGAQNLILAVGPADGWSETALARAKDEARSGNWLVLSLGSMTLPHELARVVLAEQVYRALTILAGHPYHGGH
jgi:23S rRNA (pseudouridine1915-N3)-methyltransferase